MQFDVLHDGRKIGGNLTQDAAEVFAKDTRAHYRRASIPGSVVVVPVDGSPTHLFEVFLDWPVQFECIACRARPEPIPHAEHGKRAVAVGPIRALPVGWVAMLFAGGHRGLISPEEMRTAVGDIGGRAPAVICASCTPKISWAIEIGAATIPRTDLPACQESGPSYGGPDPTCPGCAAEDIDNRMNTTIDPDRQVEDGAPGIDVLHPYPKALDWKWSRDESGAREGIAVHDGITWGVSLWARMLPTVPSDLWRITRNGRGVCYGADPNCLYTFATPELAAAGAEWCAAHPCCCAGGDCRLCGNSRVSKEPPGRIPSESHFRR